MSNIEIGKRRWRIERSKKRIVVPTLGEIMVKENLSRLEAAEKAISICGKAHKDSDIDCFRITNGHQPCDLCPKYGHKRIRTEWGWTDQVIPAR